MTTARPGRPVSRAQLRALAILASRVGLSCRGQRLAVCRWATGRPLASTTELTAAEVEACVDALVTLDEWQIEVFLDEAAGGFVVWERMSAA